MTFNIQCAPGRPGPGDHGYPYDCYRRLFTAVARKHWLRSQAFAAFDELRCERDWEGAIELARQQKTTAMLWRALREYQDQCGKVDREVVDGLGESCRRAVLHSDRLLESACHISGALSAQGIRHAVLKGPWTRQVLYDGEPVRLYGDIDVLVGRENLKHLYATLSKVGYICGKYDPVTKGALVRNGAHRRRDVLMFSHPSSWIKVLAPSGMFEDRLLVEPHYDVSWPGKGGRRLPPLTTEYLLSGTEAATCGFGSMSGLSHVRALIVGCLSVFKDANSVLNIGERADARMAKLADVLEYARLLGADGLIRVWDAAVEYDCVPQVEFAAQYLSRIYGEDCLLSSRKPGVAVDCDIDLYGRGEGFSSANGGRWERPLELRYFDPCRVLDAGGGHMAPS